MKLADIEVKKIIYSHNDKKYKVIFTNMEKTKFFALFLSSEYAKKIAMSLEGIKSETLSSYDLFVDLLSVFKIKVEKVVIFPKDKKLFSNIYICLKNKNYKMNCSISDAIILSLKTFSRMQIDDYLLSNGELFFNEMKYKESFDIIENEEKNVISEIDILKEVLKDCVEDEKYESAAIIRDRIKDLNVKK